MQKVILSGAGANSARWSLDTLPLGPAPFPELQRFNPDSRGKLLAT